MSVEELKEKRVNLYHQIVDGCPSYMGQRIDRANFQLFTITGDAKYLFGLGALFMEKVNLNEVEFFNQRAT
jgi:hypothetical protein